MKKRHTLSKRRIVRKIDISAHAKISEDSDGVPRHLQRIIQRKLQVIMERTIRRRIVLLDPRYPPNPSAPSLHRWRPWLTMRQPAHQLLHIPDPTRPRDGRPKARAVPPHDVVPVFKGFPFLDGKEVAECRVAEGDGFVRTHLPGGQNG